MDNRKGDRHKNRTRVYVRGGSKRRKANETRRIAEEDAAKSRKINEFLTVQPTQGRGRMSDTYDGNGTDKPVEPEVDDDSDNTEYANSIPFQAQTDDLDPDADETDDTGPDSEKTDDKDSDVGGCC